MFKVGDRVIFKKGYTPPFEWSSSNDRYIKRYPGKFYLITGINEEGKININRNGANGFYPCRFEFYNPLKLRKKIK